MNNFGRVVRRALRFRWTLMGGMACALGVALLWGANIGTVYPFVEVAFQGESLQKWVAEEIEQAQQKQEELASQLDQLRREQHQARGERRVSLGNKIALAESRLQAEQEAQQRYRWLQPYIDRYLPTTPFRTLVLLIAFLLIGTAVKDLFLIGNNILVARLAHLSTFELRKLFYRRTLRMDLATFGNEGTADLMSRFTHDMDQIAAGLATLFGRMVREPLKMAACLIGAGLICWRLLFLSLIIAPVAGLLIRWLGKSLKRANRRAMEGMSRIYTALEETFRGIKIVKAFTSEAQERRHFHLRSKQYYRQSMRIARYDSLTRPCSEIMGIITICLALLAGAWLVLSNETHLLGIRMSDRPLSLGSLLLFYGLLAGAADPMRKLSDVFAQLQRATAAADRIYSRLDREPTIRDPERPAPRQRHHREITLEGVSFGYTPGRPVVEEVDLQIPFGETLAIVGPNGCGKSTLLNLLPRFFDPTEGEIRLDGVPLSQMRVRDLRGQISLVSQETLLFDDTIENNIRYGSPHATHEQVVAAARQAHAHDFIVGELGDGYDTVAGPLGGRLSGGQRQRIALARAILRDPTILLLDEATSQVDLESEQIIQQVLEQFIHDRTAVIVTHRLSILRLADRIVVMHSGRMLDVGTHEQLLARCDLYRKLHQIQFDQFKKSA